MKVEYYTESKGRTLVQNSKWSNRLFKPLNELKKRGDDWDIKFDSRGPFYGTLSDELRTDLPTEFWKPFYADSFNLGTLIPEYLLGIYGKDGETYQEAFDACFSEEMFIPLTAHQTQVPAGWVLASEKAPLKNGEIILISFESDGSSPMEVRWEAEWCGHPGGDSRANCAPCWVASNGYPCNDDPYLWKYPEVNPLSYDPSGFPIPPEPKDSDLKEPSIQEIEQRDAYLAMLTSKPLNTINTPSEDEDYYLTL